MKHNYIKATLIAAMTAATTQAQLVQQAPRLVVSIAIDQLRTDYMEQYAPLYGNDGFKKLFANGTVYTEASFPFTPVDRASAITAITTGTTPYYNGICGERWLDRATLRPTTAVESKNHPGLYTLDNASPERIKTSTLGDELKVATQGAAIVYSVAPFMDAAVLSAGHAADGAIWIDDANGNWCGTTYFFATAPQWLSPFNTQHAPYNIIRDIKPSEKAFSKGNRYKNFKQSRYVNESVSEAAIQCMLTQQMGMDGVTDLLIVTYNAGINPELTNSQEMYTQLDRALGRLISTIENRVGKGNVLFALSGTGYAEEHNVDYAKYRIPTGTFYINRTANLLNIYLSAIYGQGRYVDGYFDNQIYLNHKLLEQKRLRQNEILDCSKEFLIQSAGVSDVYTSERLTTSGHTAIEKIRNGYHAATCGDILVEVAPGWSIHNEDTQQTNQNQSGYSSFPIILYGANIKPQRVTTPVTADRIAPTIAKSIHIRAPNASMAAPLD